MNRGYVNAGPHGCPRFLVIAYDVDAQRAWVYDCHAATPALAAQAVVDEIGRGWMTTIVYPSDRYLYAATISPTPESKR